jgi:hypothetical protein
MTDELDLETQKLAAREIEEDIQIMRQYIPALTDDQKRECWMRFGIYRLAVEFILDTLLRIARYGQMDVYPSEEVALREGKEYFGKLEAMLPKYNHFGAMGVDPKSLMTVFCALDGKDGSKLYEKLMHGVEAHREGKIPPDVLKKYFELLVERWALYCKPVMVFVQGTAQVALNSLRTAIAEKPLPLNEVASLCGQLADEQYAHICETVSVESADKSPFALKGACDEKIIDYVTLNTVMACGTGAFEPDFTRETLKKYKAGVLRLLGYVGEEQVEELDARIAAGTSTYTAKVFSPSMDGTPPKYVGILRDGKIHRDGMPPENLN